MELRQTKSKVICDTEYEVTQLGAIKGTKVFTRVLRLMGPAFLDKSPGKFFDSLKEEDVEYLCQTFSPLTLVKGQGQLDGIFDVHFAGRYDALVQWLVFCLQVNFGSFLEGKGLGAALDAVAPQQKPFA